MTALKTAFIHQSNKFIKKNNKHIRAQLLPQMMLIVTRLHTHSYTVKSFISFQFKHVFCVYVCMHVYVCKLAHVTFRPTLQNLFLTLHLTGYKSNSSYLTDILFSLVSWFILFSLFSFSFGDRIFVALDSVKLTIQLQRTLNFSQSFVNLPNIEILSRYHHGQFHGQLDYTPSPFGMLQEHSTNRDSSRVAKRNLRRYFFFSLKKNRESIWQDSVYSGHPWC